METTTMILIGGLGAAGLMTLLWVVEVVSKDASQVDVGWSASVGLIAVFFAVASAGHPTGRVVAGALAGLWSLRLTVYLLRDRILGKPEDGRYVVLRAKWGKNAHAAFFVFFQAQALLALLFALPVLVIAMNPDPLAWPQAVLAGLVWLTAVIGESIADRQLARFRADPSNRGKTCRVGLWSVSRHPNYFFEWLHWWTYPLLAIGAPWGWTTLLAPALMFFFLFKVTGIPATERRALETRGEDYRAYQRTVSVFVPWFPNKESGKP